MSRRSAACWRTPNTVGKAAASPSRASGCARDAVRSGVKVEVFLYTPKAARQYAEALEEMGTACGGGMEIAEELSDYMADTAAPQGVYGHLPGS